MLSFLILSLALSSAFAFPSLARNEAFIIMNNLPLWTESGGKLSFKENLTIGDKVSLMNRTAKFKQEGKEREYKMVKAPSGNVGWVRAPYAVDNCTLGVVRVDGAIVYSEPREIKMTAQSVSYMTIVAVLADGGSSDFARILCYDADKDAYFTETPVFVSRRDLTFADADLNAVIIYDTAKSTKNKAMRENFLKLIRSKYSGSLFFGKIQEGLEPPAPKLQACTGDTASFVNDDKVNVRNAPVDGSVIDQLGKGTELELLEQTVDLYKAANPAIGPQPWYHVRYGSGKEGWIFGEWVGKKE